MMIWWGKVDKLLITHLSNFVICYQLSFVDNNLLKICILHTYPQFYEQVDKSLWMIFDVYGCGKSFHKRVFSYTFMHIFQAC